MRQKHRKTSVTAARGTVYLVPNTLDFGTGGAADQLPDLQDVIALGVIRRAAGLGHWVCENAKTTRAFLKRVDAVVGLAASLQSISIVELPRPAKGRDGRAAAAALDLTHWLEPALAGSDIGLLSEAGLPAVADPGAEFVGTAHRAGLAVVPLAGASSLLLALAASGLNGQSFAFVGYLPVESSARSDRIRELEALSRRTSQTQLMIETPYRNPALLAALLAALGPATRLSASCGLTLPGGFTRSDTVSNWRRAPTALPTDVPVVFAFVGA